jgi:hypothetical protein
MMQPVDDRVDHVRGPAGARTLVEYGDYECPFSRPSRSIFHKLPLYRGVKSY